MKRYCENVHVRLSELTSKTWTQMVMSPPGAGNDRMDPLQGIPRTTIHVQFPRSGSPGTDRKFGDPFRQSDYRYGYIHVPRISLPRQEPSKWPWYPLDPLAILQ